MNANNPNHYPPALGDTEALQSYVEPEQPAQPAMSAEDRVRMQENYESAKANFVIALGSNALVAAGAYASLKGYSSDIVLPLWGAGGGATVATVAHSFSNVKRRKAILRRYQTPR